MTPKNPENAPNIEGLRTEFDNPKHGRICPVSGEALLRKPHWKFQSENSDFYVIYFRLGQNVIVAQPSGYAKRPDMESSVRKNTDMIDDCLPPDEPYVHLADYSRLRGASLSAQKYFIDSIRRRPRLRGLVFCGLSPYMQMAVKIGRKLNQAPFPVEIAKDYAAGVKRVREILEETGLPVWPSPFLDSSPTRNRVPRGIESYRPTDLPDAHRPPAAGNTPVPTGTVESRPGWSYEDDDFRTRFEVISGRYLHSISEGVFQERHVAAVTDLRRHVLKTKESTGHLTAIIARVDGVKMATHHARLRYFEALKLWHREAPLSHYIFYGAGPFVRAAVALSRPFAPFRIHVANDLSSSLKILDENPAGEAPDTPGFSSSPSAAPSHRDVDDLMQYLGRTNWDEKDLETPSPVASSHPLFPVYEGIRLVRTELDVLYKAREEADSRRREAELKLHQARKMKAVGNLAAGVAHDLNNILSGIVSYPDLLLRDLDKDSPLREPLTTIRKAGRKASRLVSDLASLSGQGLRRSFNLNLKDVLADLLDSTEFTLLCNRYPRVGLEHETDENLMHVVGSPTHLLKLMRYLLANAYEGVPGSGTCFLSLRNCHMDRAYDGYEDVPPGDYVRLVVSDTGTGFPEEKKNQLFEPFFTKNVLGRKQAGLGLSVVWGIAKDHGGFIDVDTDTGRGTSIAVYFPAVDAMQPETGPTGDETRPAAAARLLVVDDDETQLTIARQMLEGQGYRVDTATSGEEAIERIRKNPVDLLVLDMIMPGLDGLDTFKKILEFRPNQHAIICTGYADSDRATEARRVGASALLLKPYLSDELAQAVHMGLEGKGPDSSGT